jgi:uridine nucleosidase
VAAILSGIGNAEYEIPFYDFEGTAGEGKSERYEVTVVTEGSYEDAQAGARTGQTIAKLLPEGEEGVRIPRGLDIPRFWKALEECVARADEANTAAASGVN